MHVVDVWFASISYTLTDRSYRIFSEDEPSHASLSCATLSWGHIPWNVYNQHQQNTVSGTKSCRLSGCKVDDNTSKVIEAFWTRTTKASPENDEAIQNRAMTASTNTFGRSSIVHNLLITTSWDAVHGLLSDSGHPLPDPGSTFFRRRKNASSSHVFLGRRRDSNRRGARRSSE